MKNRTAIRPDRPPQVSTQEMQSYQLYTGESWQEALYQVVKVNASSDKMQ